MKVLVTGGAGFIGSNLCRVLLSHPAVDGVSVLDDLSSGTRDVVDQLGVDLVVGSILDEAALARAGAGVDAIVHLAAIPSVPRSVANPLPSHEANATGTLRVLELARELGGAQVVVASSSSVYGANPTLPKTEDLRCEPMSPYAVSKLAAEQYASAYASCYDLPVLPFRFFNVFGPLQRAGHAYAAVVPAWIDAALRGRALPLNGDGSQSRDFTFVGTVTEVITDAVVNRVTSGPVNLALGTRTTLLELADMISREVGVALEFDRRPTREGDVPHSQAGSDNLRALFRDVEPVALEQGVRETVAWMRSELESAS